MEDKNGPARGDGHRRHLNEVPVAGHAGGTGRVRRPVNEFVRQRRQVGGGFCAPGLCRDAAVKNQRDEKDETGGNVPHGHGELQLKNSEFGALAHSARQSNGARRRHQAVRGAMACPGIPAAAIESHRRIVAHTSDGLAGGTGSVGAAARSERIASI